MSFFFIYKIREQECRIGPDWRFGTSGRREEVRKWHGRVKIVQIMCAHVCK
jgi:hypothetical protein